MSKTSQVEALKAKYQTLCDILSQYDKVAVAFSGGVDSSLLLKAATDVFTGNILAFFAHSCLQKKEVLPRVTERCRILGATVKIIAVDPFLWPELVGNKKDRCYHCKKRIYAEFLNALPDGYILIDGTNIDDLSQDRPGRKAIVEYGVKTPLVEADFTKNDVRMVSRQLGLSWWDLPSDSCLATRVDRGVPLAASLLQLVEASEAFLAEGGYVGCRVRVDGEAAFVSLSQGDMVRFVEESYGDRLISFFRKYEISKVFLDLSERESIVF